MKRKKLSFLLEERIIEPLSNLLEQPKRNAKKFLIKSIASSGVIASLISMTTQPNFLTLGISATAGTISAGINQLIEQQAKKKIPTKFLITSLRKMKIKEDFVIQRLREIPQQTMPEK